MENLPFLSIFNPVTQDSHDDLSLQKSIGSSTCGIVTDDSKQSLEELKKKKN